MKGAMKMAWITEQALADYLNWYPNRNENEELLHSLLAEDVTFTMGTRCYRGIDAVMNEFSNMSDAISSDYGFVARPVIAKEMLSDNPDQFIRRKAIALCSKLEEYISWLFFIKVDPDSYKIIDIYAIMGSKYQHPLYYDLYELKQPCKS